MMNTRKKTEEFLAELAAPIGPEVFAGIGSPLQNLRYQWDQEYGFDISDQEEEFIKHWLNEQDAVPTLDALFDIARHPPGVEFYDGIATRRKFEWDYWLAKLIYLLGMKDKPDLLRRLEKDGMNENALPALTMVKEDLEDES